MDGRSLSEILSEYVTNIEYKELPTDVIDKTKECMLDFIGVAAIGSRSKIGQILIDVMKEFNEKSLATIIGTNLRVSPPSAALVNSVMAHAYEFDDVTPGHPGCIIIPAALSLVNQNIEGKDLILAIVLGYEVMGRIGAAYNLPGIRLTPRLHGFHSFTTQGVFGSAAAAGKILKLDRIEMVNAFGIAGTQASGLAESINVGAMTKPLDAGRASQSGVYSAILARKGLQGAKSIFEGKDGFYKAFSFNGYDISKVTENLGNNFQIMHTFFKFYPCCAGLHLAIDAACYLNQQGGFSIDEIDDVEIKTNEHAFKSYNKTILHSIQDAQFSLPYVTAVALKKGNVTLEDFSEESIRNSAILKLAQKIGVNSDSEKYYPKTPVEVSVTTKDGIKHIKKIDTRKERKFDELQIKFINLTTPILGQEKAKKLLDTIKHLEKIKGITSLLDLLVLN
jgi:2-methylcitrate dehydratase PrpD